MEKNTGDFFFLTESADITDRKKIEDEILANEEKYRAFFATSMDCIFVTTLDGKWVDFNEAAIGLFGYESREELMEVKISDMYADPADRKEHIRNIIEKGYSFEYPVNLRKKDGTIISTLITSVARKDGKGNIIGFQGTIRDITRRKQVEKALKESEEKYRMLADLSSDMITIFDLNGVITYASPAVKSILGYTPEEIIGKNAFDFSTGVNKKEQLQMFHEFKAGKRDMNKVQVQLSKKDGTFVIVENIISPIFKEGTLAGLLLVGRDITESMRAEDALRESEERYRNLFISSRDAIMTIEPPDWRFTSANPATVAMFRAKDEADLISRWPWKLSPEYQPDGRLSAEKAKENIGKAVKEGSSFFEWTHRRLNGEDFPATVLATRFEWKGQIIVQGTVRDITETKAAKARINELLRLQEEQVEIINTSPAVAFLWKAEENWPVETVSENISRFGYTPDDFISGRVLFSSIIHPDDLERVVAEVEHNSTNNIDSFYQIYRIFGKDKKEYWIEDFTKIRRDSAGTITHYQGIVLNITDRKLAERALERSYNILKGVIESPKNVVIFALDRQYRYTAFNENHRHTMKQIWGVDIATGNSMLEYISNPDDRKKAKINFDRALSGESFTLIEAYGDTLLERRWYEDIYNPVTDENGTVIGLTLILTDITNRKQVEEALKISENRYRTLFEESPISLWEEDFSDLKIWLDNKKQEGEFDPAVYFKKHPEEVSRCARMVKVIHINRATMTLFGAASFQEFGKGLLTIFSKDSLDAFREELIALSGGETEFEKETPFRTLQGEPKIVIMKVTVVPGYEQTFSRIFVSGIDITERKNVEGALHQANKKLNMLSSITRHDILNLIMAIRGYLELSEDLVDNPELKEYMKRENQAVDSIQRQIEFTRYYQDIGVEKPKWQDAGNIVGNVSQQLNLSGITVNNQLSGLEIFADPLIEKVFYNLVENSLRHGKHVTSISFSYSETATGLILSYRDDGVGISQEYRKQLFQKGFGRHTGLGLFLSREILSITSITITENGEPGKGVNFEILVPKGGYRIPR